MNPSASNAPLASGGPVSGLMPLWPDAAPSVHRHTPMHGESPGFCEALEGLQVRELHNLDLFQLLFGPPR